MKHRASSGPVPLTGHQDAAIGRCKRSKQGVQVGGRGGRRGGGDVGGG